MTAESLHRRTLIHTQTTYNRNETEQEKERDSRKELRKMHSGSHHMCEN